MSVNLRKMTVFANFSILHILPQNETIFTFLLSWCQEETFSFIFKGVPENKKKLKFSKTAELQKMTIFASFSVLNIWPQNKWIFTFHLSGCQVGMFSLIFKGFPENKKNEVFDNRGPAKNDANFSILHILPQNEYFYISVGLMLSRDVIFHFQRLSRK